MKAAAVMVMVTVIVLVAAAVINAQQGHGAAFAPEGGPAQRARAAAAPPTHTAPAPAPAPAARFVPIIMIPVFALVNGIFHSISIIQSLLSKKNLAPLLFGFYDDKLWGRQTVTKNSPSSEIDAPILFKFEGPIDEPHDTWIDLREWGTGTVFVNGFKLGQYSYLGPDNALLWPASQQRGGQNEDVYSNLAFKMYPQEEVAHTKTRGSRRPFMSRLREKMRLLNNSSRSAVGNGCGRIFGKLFKVKGDGLFCGDLPGARRYLGGAALQIVVLELLKAPADFALSLFDEPIVG